MSFNQGEFDFDQPDDSGWRLWRERLDARKRAFEERWGVILDQPVRLRLRDHTKSMTGTIHWIEQPKAAPDAPPRFRIRSLEFGADEIESLVKLD